MVGVRDSPGTNTMNSGIYAPPFPPDPSLDARDDALPGSFDDKHCRGGGRNRQSLTQIVNQLTISTVNRRFVTVDRGFVTDDRRFRQ